MNLIIIIIARVFKNVLVPYDNVIENYSLMMIYFNILPIYPLDGERIFRIFLELFFDNEYARDINFYFSILLITIFGILFLIFKKYFYQLIILYLLVMNIKMRKSSKFKLQYISHFLKEITYNK